MTMKLKLKLIYVLSALTLLFSACEAYLDKAPNIGLSETDVYKNYTTMLGYLDQIYTGDPPILANIFSINKYENATCHPATFSDEAAAVYNDSRANFLNSGNWLEKGTARWETGTKGNSYIAQSYKGLRIVNRVITDIDKVQVLSEEEKEKLLGQAYFLRAHFYFELLKRYGGMPIFNTLLGPADDLDLPRKTYQECQEWMETDLDKAIEYLPVQWDEQNEGRPTRISALALKEMTQLYASSPLMQNDLNTIEDHGYGKGKAAQAAVTAQQCLDEISVHPYYKLMPKEQYREIFLIPQPNLYAQPEYLWYDRVKHPNQSAMMRAFFITQPWESKTGTEGTPFTCPTQNIVDMFEKKGPDGNYYPITDPLSGYDPQNPYIDRDPRFSNDIIYPGEAWGKNLSGQQVYAPLYQGGYIANFLSTNQFTNARQMTGYMCKKWWWPEANNIWQNTFDTYRIITVYIRVAQVYLDFAEASFEATGSATAIVPGCKMNAVEALNVIRNRAGIGDLPTSYVNDPDKFRAAYRRERAVELLYENHRWFDIRRWMIAVDLFKDKYPIKGINAIPKNHLYTAAQLKALPAIYYKLTDFDYETVDVITEVRNFQTRNYWYPFPLDDVASLKNLKQNPGW